MMNTRSTLRFYLTILRRRWLLVLLGFAVPVGIAVALTVTATKMYEGSAAVVINRRALSDQVTNSPNPTASTSDFLSIVQTYADTARSTQLADQVARALPSARVSGRALLAHSAVTPSQNADVLNFTVQNRDGPRAQALATTYATQFVSFQVQQAAASIRLALHQIDIRLGQARKHDKTLVPVLTGRDQQLRTLAALQTANNFVINPTASASVASPKPATNIALGILAGILLAALLAGLREALDTRVRTSEDVETILGIPLLGRIGPPPKRYRQRVLSRLEPSSPAAEGFRILRTNLELQTMRNRAKVFMVSSAVEYEGKSVTIANLAVATARAGRRTILVDLDLRVPTQDKLFEAGGRVPGITNVLLERVPIGEALYEVALSADPAEIQPGGSLRLLRAGILPPDPGEVVASSRLRALFELLRTEADVIYVDTPPMLRAGDAMAISSLCDAVFLVARIADVRRPALNELARLIARCPVPVAGFVATGKESGKWAYGYRDARYARAIKPEPGLGSSQRPQAEPVISAQAAATAAAPPQRPAQRRPQDSSPTVPVSVPGQPGAAVSDAVGQASQAPERSSGPDRAALPEFFRSRRAKRLS